MNSIIASNYLSNKVISAQLKYINVLYCHYDMIMHRVIISSYIF